MTAPVRWMSVVDVVLMCEGGCRVITAVAIAPSRGPNIDIQTRIK